MGVANRAWRTAVVVQIADRTYELPTNEVAHVTQRYLFIAMLFYAQMNRALCSDRPLQQNVHGRVLVENKIS